MNGNFFEMPKSIYFIVLSSECEMPKSLHFCVLSSGHPFLQTVWSLGISSTKTLPLREIPVILTLPRVPSHPSPVPQVLHMLPAGAAGLSPALLQPWPGPKAAGLLGLLPPPLPLPLPPLHP